MQIKMKCERALAFVLALLMLMTMIPTAAFAEELPSDVATSTDVATDPVASQENETVSEEPTAPDDGAEQSAAEDSNAAADPAVSEEDAPAIESEDIDSSEIPDDAPEEPELDPENEIMTEEETDHDDGAEIPVDPAVDVASEEEAAADDAPQELADDASSDTENADDTEVIPEVIQRPVLRSVANPSRFSGAEEIRLGKEGGNIYNIIVQKNGSESTSIARHWVTVDGAKYTAFCIEASKSSTSGRDGGLQPGTDAGLLWILSNVPDSTDEEYVIKQQAVWAYLGQSFSISGLAAGSRCSLSTDQLRERLTEIVTSAQNASLTGDKELWIAYHLENRNTYQDMAFIVDEPDPIPGAIRIMKLDSATGTVLAGATFELLDGSTVIATATTGADGVVTFTDIMPGTYTVRESSAPEGYILGEVTVQTVTVSDGQTATATFVNDKSSSRVKIIKVDAQTGAPLTGASFTITRLSGPAVNSGMAIGESITLVTDENGEIETDWLEWGQYCIEETAAPDGYINSGFSEIIEAYEDEEIYAFTVENELMSGGIQIIKTDADTGAALSGAMFEVVNSAGTVVGTATTNADGVAYFTDLLVDTYTIRETGAPTGYTLSTPKEQILTVVAGQTAYATFANEKISGKIAIYKVDADSKEPLAGAAFSVTDADGNVVATLVTDANGTAETNLLPYGTYTVTETAAPDHYINSGVSVNISITEHGKTYTIEAENEPMTGGLIVRKKDSVTGFAISGVQFDIYRDGELIATMTTDANGVATCTGLDAGTYTVKEHALPTGYVGELVVLEGTVTSDVTTVLDVTNIPSQSKIQIIKTDSVTGEKLSGAEFSIANAAGTVIGQLITGEDGTTISGWLPYGVYTITETQAPDSYINRGFSTRIEAYENGKTYIIEVENEPTKGGIKVIKTDALTQQPIAGVQFDVYQNDTLVGTMTTNEQGVAFIEDLEKGTYIVREHALPSGYVGELAEMTAVVESEKITELAATNIPSRSRVRIVKTDALSGDVLAGAEFTVTDASGNVIEVLTTGADGTAESDWLIYGSYTITESAAPDHYINSGFTQTIDAFEDGKTYEFTVTNQPTEGGIRLMKTDALSGKPIVGVEFHVYSGSTLIGTMTTDANGVATINDLEPGSYTVKEAALPTGYTGELVELEAVVQSDVTCELTATNTPSRSKVRIVKTDALSGDVLSGAEFTVTDAYGSVIEVLTTGEDGTTESDWLIYGSYTITETAAPDHYINSGFTQIINAFEDGKTYEFTVTNQPTEGGIHLMKTDALSGKPIAGVEFHVYYGTALIGTMITDANGIATINDLEPGSYTVKEAALPTGYTGELVELEAIVQSDTTCELTATNTPSRSKVRIIKNDALTGDALAGAEFTVTNALGTVVEVLTTGVDGTAESDWLIYGSYTITETAAPDHYINGSFTQTIDAFEDGKTYEFSVSNAPTKGGICLSKTDSETGAPIEGVKFNIFMGDTLVATMTTDENGVATCDGLDKGTYIVKEDALPEGYTGELVVLEAVVQSDAVTELHAVNCKSKSRIRIIKTDALTGEAVSGAEFTVTDEIGNVFSIITGENGEVTTDWLPYGVYTVTETKAPEHYLNGGFTQSVDAFEDGKTYEFTVTNAPTKGGIRLIKTDSETGAPIEGVKFNIFHGDTLIATMTTDENGVATCDNLDKGTYIVKEDTLPEGYTGELVVLEAVVQSDAVTELHAVNCKSKSRIRIIKTDVLTGEAVSGAEFTVTDEVGNVFSIITDENGEVITDWLPYGVYTITETKAPDHYVNNGWSERIAAYENGTTYTFEVENEPTKGIIQLVKTDHNDGTPIAGVVFGIYHGDELISTMTTDEAGKATSEPLDKGVYTVKEEALPTGYVGKLATLEAVVTSDSTTELAVTNKPIMGKIAIHKSDALTGEMLAGAEFTIKRLSGLPSHNGSGDGEIVAVVTTNGEGYAETPMLTYGTYLVTETKVPEHYVNDPYVCEVTISEHEQTYTVYAENEPTRGWIRLVKTNSLDQTPIEGVIFDISQDSQVIGSIVTDENGVAVSDPLPKGTYTVSERDTPTGYVYEIVNLKAEVRSDETTELIVTNKPIQGKFRIEKRDSLTGDRLAGATFTVTRVSGLPSHNGSNGGEVVATVTTDINGVAETPWLTYGVYRVEETGVPEHYVDNGFSVEAVINEEDMGTYLVDCENEPTKGFIQLVKVDALDRTPIAGVVFDIYDNGELVSSMTTNEDGIALSEPLHKGEYQVCERDNPTGYTDELVVLDAVVKSDETTHLSCTNQPIQGRIQIMKRDQLTKEALAGAEFTVTRVSGLPSHNGSNDGEVVAVITTDANGMAITPLLTWGTYRIEETGVPEHYVDNSFCIDVTISEDQKIYTVDVENEPTKGWIRLTKTDRLNGNPIEGVQFDIYYNDQYGEGLAGTMVTDANGIALSEPLRKGQYIVREHGETAGYIFEEIELAATVKSDEITDVAATNMPVLVQLTIYKRDVDEYDGDDPNTNPRNKAIPTMPNDYNIPDPATRGDGVLTGTVFQVSAGADIVDRQGYVIYPEGTIIIESLTTAGDAASVTTEPLWPGLYAVQEIKAPTGYQIDPNPFYVDSRGAAMQSTVPTVTFSGLSRNEILYGAQAIVKVLGNNDNTTDPTRVEIPEAGAEFKVYLKSAGSYEAARDIERDYLITDENGYAMTKPLPYGVYVLEQTAGKDGYEIKGPIEFSIDGTENLDNPPPLTLSDKPILYRLKLIKTDADTGKVITLANTSFKIKDSKGEYITQTVYYPREMEIDTFTTDATGSVTLPEVVNWGHYFIEEIVAPEGYLIRTDELAVFIGNSGDTPGETYEVEIEIPNEAVMGRIELVKTGLTLTGFMTCTENGYEVTLPIYEDRYLAGATFEIRAAEDIIGGDGTLWYTKDALVETITTSGTGSDMSKELPLGRYYLIETGAPVGYILEDVPYEADLTYLDGHTPVVTIQVRAGNKYLPASISLVKHKEVTEVVASEDETVHQIITTAPGEGFTFGLYNAKDIHYLNGTLLADTLMAVGVTDEQGLLHISGYFPHGEYYIKELAAPDGWKINPNLFPVSILPDMVAEDAAVIEVVYPEVVYDELIYTPITLTKTDITGAETVPGALIEVKDETGTVIYRAFTDANGEIPDIPVVPGTYTFREVLAPEDYELNTAEMTFTVDELGNITGDTVIRDDYTRVTLVKQDMEGNPLVGVEFGLLWDDDFLVAVAKSDANGVVTFERIPYGKYTIREIQPLSGYLRSDTVVHLTVDGTFVNPAEPLAVIENHPIEVILHKIDKDNKPLPGAIFGLFDSDGFLCMTALSDATGTVKFQYVPYGSYTIREIEAPDGYLLSQTVIPVEIDAAYHNSVEPLATVVNQAARLQYKKVDTSGKLLPGVEFSLINADSGEVVEVVTSDDAGEFVFTRFTYGNWVVRETKAPEGYNVMPDIELKVDENWVEPEPFTLVNIPNHYEFVKIDNKGNPMPGVKFTLEDGAGNILRDLVSGEDGIVHVTDLTPGVYIIREIETLEGYTLSEETIKVVIDEQYVVPDEMFRFVNYPNIQTGAGFEMTSLMWSGVALVITSCAAVMVFLLLNKRRPRT